MEIPIQFILFLITGGLNTLIAYAIYASFIALHFDYTIAVLMGSIIGILINFQTTGRIVFKNSNPALMWKFFLTSCFLYFLSLSEIHTASLFMPNLYVCGLVPNFINPWINYFLSKNWVFRS